jgi:hypothetical protein
MLAPNSRFKIRESSSRSHSSTRANWERSKKSSVQVARARVETIPMPARSGKEKTSASARRGACDGSARVRVRCTVFRVGGAWLIALIVIVHVIVSVVRRHAAKSLSLRCTVPGSEGTRRSARICSLHVEQSRSITCMCRTGPLSENFPIRPELVMTGSRRGSLRGFFFRGASLPQGLLLFQGFLRRSQSSFSLPSCAAARRRSRWDRYVRSCSSSPSSGPLHLLPMCRIERP